MYAFPRFKSSRSYHPYKKQALTNWESMIYKTGFVFLLLEFSRLLEDLHHDGYADWSVLWVSKVVNIGFYGFVTFIRFFLIKIMKNCKRQFLDISEVLILLFFILMTIYGAKLPTSRLDPNPIWQAKEILRSFTQLICLCFSFYNWILPVLIISTNISYYSYMYNKLVPGFAWLYMPTYVTIIVCLLIFSYYFEKIRRQNFEDHLDANMKEKVWKEILNEFPEGTLIVNKKKEIVYVNHAFYSILNINLNNGIEELLELTRMRDISIEEENSDVSVFGSDHHPITKFKELQESIWERWTDLVTYFTSPIAHDEYKMFKGQFKFDEGGSKTFEIKFSIRHFGGENVALFIFSDVSERLLVSYLKQTIEYKNRLLASVSHELRTPLNGNINFILEAINDSTVPTSIKEARLIPAMRSAKYLLTLINDILDFSQIQAQNLRLVPTVKNIVDTVKEAMELIEIQAKKKGLYLTLDIPENSSSYCEIKTDHNRVLQIIANLLSNALKFTFSGGIKISVTPEEGNNVICIEVEDTGIGIKQEDQSKLFKAFGKLDLGGKNYINSQGVGLGLVISNSLACMLGPKFGILEVTTQVLGNKEKPIDQENGIQFESEYGKGTKFWFRILNQDENKSPSFHIVASERSRVHEIPESIFTESYSPLLPSKDKDNQISCTCAEFLIADDDAFNILTLESLLKSLGFRTESAYNGQQVIEKILKRISTPCGISCRPYKLIFLDCNMPIMDGYECAGHLKELFQENPEYACPLIACTAATQQSERDKALEAGMTDFVTKPISRLRIQELVKSFHSKPLKKLNFL